MTELPPIDDELLSAYLDGEVTAAERGAIEADTAALARLGELRAVRDAVASPVEPLADKDRDRLIAAALAASETTRVVSEIGVARARRRFWDRPAPPQWNWRPIAVVAAAVVAIAIAVPVVRSADLGGDAADTAGEGAIADEPASEEATEAAAFEAPTTAETFSAPDQSELDTVAPDEPASADDSVDADAVADESMAAAEPTDGGGDLPFGFDPMEAELGEFADTEALSERVFADFEAWLADPIGVAERHSILEEEHDPACFDEIGAEPSEIGLQSDVAAALVSGVEHEVWLFEDGTSVIAPTVTCSPASTSNFFEG